MSAQVAPALGGMLAGLLLGLVHFGSLWWNTQLYTRGAALPALGLQLLRLGVLLGGLVLLARLGTAVLLAAALGVLLGRAAVMWRVRRSSQ